MIERLGLAALSSNISWRLHLLKMHQKASKKLNLLKPFKYNLSHNTLEVLFNSWIRPSLEYAGVVWDVCSGSDSNLLESLQIEGARVVTGALKWTNRVSLLNELYWVDLSVRGKFHKLRLMYEMVFKLTPPYLCDLCPDFVFDRYCCSLGSANSFCLPYVRTDRDKTSLLFSTIKWWYSLSVRDTHVVSSWYF